MVSIATSITSLPAYNPTQWGTNSSDVILIRPTAIANSSFGSRFPVSGLSGLDNETKPFDTSSLPLGTNQSVKYTITLAPTSLSTKSVSEMAEDNQEQSSPRYAAPRIASCDACLSGQCERVACGGSRLHMMQVPPTTYDAQGLPQIPVPVNLSNGGERSDYEEHAEEKSSGREDVHAVWCILCGLGKGIKKVCECVFHYHTHADICAMCIKAALAARKKLRAPGHSEEDSIDIEKAD